MRLRAVVVAVLALGACEKAVDTPARFDHRPRRSAEELAARDAALVQLDETLAGVQRARSPVEAPTALTNAYVALELAYGFALVGDAVRAQEHVAAARAVLDGLVGDPVHATLLALYRERIAAALVGAPSDTAPTIAARAHLAALDRVNRYKVDRLREVSVAANGGVPPDAIAAFSRKQVDARGPEAAQLAAIADPVARAAAIAKLVDGVVAASGSEGGADAGGSPSIATARGADVVVACVDAMPGAGDATGVVRVAPLVARVPVAMRAVVAAVAANAASRLAHPELVAGLVDQALAAAAATPAARADDAGDVPSTESVANAWAVRESLRVGRRVGVAGKVIAPRIAALTAPGSETKSPEAIVAAGYSVQPGDPTAIRFVDAARGRLAAEQVTQPERTELTRALASAYANAPIAVGLPAIADVAAKTLPMTTDSFGTNSHYALSVIAVVDALVLGIAGDD